MQRDEALQRFTDAVLAAYREHAHGTESRASLDRIAACLETPAPRRTRPGSRLPVCAHLDTALAVETGKDSLRALIETFRAIEPSLEWQRRASFDETASSNFPDGHANAMILGPAGLENRNDIWLGVSLMAPGALHGPRTCTGGDLSRPVRR
jgi:Dimethlysulfonioproprionate lyase